MHVVLVLAAIVALCWWLDRQTERAAIVCQDEAQRRRDLAILDARRRAGR